MLGWYTTWELIPVEGTEVGDIIKLYSPIFFNIFSPMVSEFALVTSWQLICSSNRTKENTVLMVCWRVHDQSDSRSSEVQRKTNQHWWTDGHDISYIKVCEIFPKNILQIKPERSKKYIYIFTIFLYPLPSQMVGGKLDRLCGLKRAGVWSVSNCKLR